MDVRVEGLRVERQGRLVLEIDELTIPGGKISAVLGRNGAGKTTLLRVLSGLLRPSAGSVRLGEMMLWPSPPPSARPSLAFQEPVFLRGTVRDNLELALSLRGVGEAERRTRAEEAARDLEVLHLLDRPARELSRGEGQRVSLARALSLRAPLTLLDEPLGALDAMVRARLLHELPRLLRARGGTAMIVTHDREEAFFLADYLIVLIGGRVRAAGDAGSVLRSPPDVNTAELLGYTVVSLGGTGGAALGVPPGELSLGEGPYGLEMLVERSVDRGSHYQVIGVVAGTRMLARAPIDAPSPAPGERVPVTPGYAVELPAK